MSDMLVYKKTPAHIYTLVVKFAFISLSNCTKICIFAIKYYSCVMNSLSKTLNLLKISFATSSSMLLYFSGAQCSKTSHFNSSHFRKQFA